MTATANPVNRQTRATSGRAPARKKRRRRLNRRGRILVAGLIACLAVSVIVAIAISASSGKTEVIGTETSESSKQAETAAPDTAAETAEAIGVVTEPPETSAPEFIPDPADVEMLAKLIWGEARGVRSTAQKAAVVWCVLNRVDASGYACGGSIEHVVTFPGQFVGYNESFPATEEFKAIAADVLKRWNAEKEGAENVGRVLPSEYLFFTGDGKVNTFTTEWDGGNVWNWSLPSPYEN